MKHRICYPLLLAALFVAFTQSGCKENVLIDSGISPSDNALGVYDTSLNIITHSYNEDTAITNFVSGNGAGMLQAVGAMEDPFFGTITGGTFFQLLPENPTSVVYDGKTIDSAVLVLPFSGFKYGDTADQTSIAYQVFFMDEGISKGTNYYAFDDKHIDLGAPLSEAQEMSMYKLKDSLQVAGKNYAPGLRIRLKLSALLNRLTPALASATGAADPNGNFMNIFKGVCVRVADNRRMAHSLPYFNMDGSTPYTNAGIIVYAHTNGASDTVTQRYVFNSGSCGFFNNVSRSYSHYPVNSLYTSTAANDSVIGIQNSPGANLDIVIPGIKSLPTGVINKAEIRLSVLPWRKDSRFQPVDFLYPIRVNTGTYPAGLPAGTRSPVYDDYIYTGANAFNVINGRLNSITTNGTATQTYTINIPREVMTSLKAGNDTLHVRITGSAAYTGAFRALLGGGNHPDAAYKAKLFVVYSALNK